MAREQSKAQIEARTRNAITKEDASEKGKIGAKKSLETRRKKKKLKEALTALMELPVSERNKQSMRALGIDDKDMNNQMLVAVAAFQKAIKGDVRAMEFIRDMTGQQPVTKLDEARIKLLRAQAKQIEVEIQREAAENESESGVMIVDDLPKGECDEEAN